MYFSNREDVVFINGYDTFKAEGPDGFTLLESDIPVSS